MRTKILLALFFLACGGRKTLAADVTFVDSLFNDSDWSAQIVHTINHNACGTFHAEFTAFQVLTGGDPGAYRHVTHTFADGELFVAHLNNHAIWNPVTDGGISQILYSQDVNYLSGPGAPPFAVGYDLLLKQGSEYYISLFTYTQDVWVNSQRSSLTANDFTRLFGTFGIPGGPDKPDFSKSGPPIQFGFHTRNGADGCNTYVTDHGIDNWQVTIHPCDCPRQGDLAQNGVIDVNDVLAVIKVAFINGTDVQDPLCPKTRSNVNNLGPVDVNDVLYIIKTAFSNGPAPVNPCP